MAERSESSNSSAETATLRSNRQRRWEMLNRSLEDDLNRISVVAEDDNGGGAVASIENVEDGACMP